MKKIILLISAFLMSVFVFGQKTPDVIYPITKNCVINVLGQAGDTAIKNGNVTYRMYVSNYCEKFKMRPIISRTRGNYTKSRVIISGSLNAVTYVNLDTVTIAGSGTILTGESDLIEPYYPYIKVVMIPYDSTQTLKILNTFLIKKD